MAFLSAQTNELLTCKVSITTVFRIESFGRAERFDSLLGLYAFFAHKVKEPKYPSFDAEQLSQCL